MTKADKEKTSKVLMSLAVVCVLLSAVGYIWTDIWLASTQWLLVASTLALFGVYMKTN